jgi:sec-independent protein translocase protein TatA
MLSGLIKNLLPCLYKSYRKIRTKRTGDRNMFGGIGMPELIVILVIALIFFGPGKLPEVGSVIGKAIRGFKKAMTEPEEKPDMQEPGKIENKKE